MGYTITITDHLRVGRIDVKRNGVNVGDIEEWGASLTDTPIELNDVFTINVTQTSSTPCPIKISSFVGYSLSFSKQKIPGWELRLAGTIESPPSEETTVNVTVGDDEPQSGQDKKD